MAAAVTPCSLQAKDISFFFDQREDIPGLLNIPWEDLEITLCEELHFSIHCRLHEGKLTSFCFTVGQRPSRESRAVLRDL